MSKLRVQSFSLSLDGFGAGPDQSLEHPLGLGGRTLHEWAFSTKTFRHMFGNDGGATGVDDDFAARGFDNLGAWILGRNMFGPIRGPWPDDHWKGWWGDTPPYHTPVFVLTHHARESVTMAGGTTFHFVTQGIYSALARATEAANGKDVRLGGGVATIQEYLRAGLVDELHLAIAPVLLGKGERLFSDIDMSALGYQCTEHVATPYATHVVLKKSGSTVYVERTFSAPVEKVWKLWNDPESMKKWWSPKDYTAPVIKNDFRVGGSFLLSMRSPQGEMFWNTGTYKEIVANRKIVSTMSFSDENGKAVPGAEVKVPGAWPDEIIITVEFKEVAGQTRVTVTEVGIPLVMKLFATLGWQQQFDKFDILLAGCAA